MNTALRLAGRIAMVTGAGSGLGSSTAERLAAEGAHSVCADLDVAAAAATASRIEGFGGRATVIELDVTSEVSHKAAVSRVLRELGGVDAYIANAGIAGPGSAVDVEPSTWDRVLAVNLTGVWLSARSVLPHMVGRGRGSIVLQASVGGLIGIPGIAAYSAAKGGVIALARQMAVEYAAQGVRVNAIAPGTVPTPLVTNSFGGASTESPDRDPARLADHPMGRLGAPSDVAAAAAYLVSDDAAWVTGIVLPVDGGRTAS